jgi:hypothetical protein
MSTTAFVKRHPLVMFFALAYALTWPVIPLVSVSPLLAFPALFGPALAAVIVSAFTDGKPGLRALLGRLVRWRVGARWDCPRHWRSRQRACTSCSARRRPSTSVGYLSSTRSLARSTRPGFSA